MSKNEATFTSEDTKAATEAAEAQLAAEGILDAPGAERRETLARKAEKLIEAANKLLEQIEVEGADPANLEVDNEVRQALNEMNEVYVSNAQAEFTYAWIFRDPHNEYGGRHVRRLQAIGWEVVSGDMPEAREHRHVDNTRVVADCLLMRIRLDRKMLLDRRDALLREAQQAGVTARVYELAERANTRVYDKLPGFIEDAMAGESARRAAARSQFHRMNAGGRMDRMLRTGTIPGVRPPGAGR